MIEREADQSRGEREPARTMARPGLCFASPSCGCSRRGLVCSPVGSGFLKPMGRAASVGSAAQLLAASRP